jgi:hypothetical protein
LPLLNSSLFLPWSSTCFFCTGLHK